MREARQRAAPRRAHGPRRPMEAAGAAAWLCGPLALLFSAAPACDPGAAARAQGPVRIGVILPRTGPNDQWAPEVMRGLELALLDQPGRFELVERDDRGEPSLSADLVHELVTQEGVLAIVGSLPSPCCLAAAERAEQLEVPLITPSGTDEEITRDRRFAFRACFTDPQQGEEMARFARTRLDLGRAAILKDVTNDYSLGLAEAFSEAFIRNDGAIVAEEAYRTGRVDRAALRSWLDGVDCDLLYLPGYYADVAPIIEATLGALTTRGIVVLGGDGWESATLRGELARWPDQVYFTAHFTPNNGDDVARTFVAAYHRAFGAESAPGSFAALGYDTGLILKQALGSIPAGDAAAARAAARDAIQRVMRSFRGATGEFAVDIDTDRPLKNVLVLRGEGDAWIPAH